MTYLNPKWVIVEFLRKNLTDPRTARQSSANSDSFTATASQTTFTLAPTTGTSLAYVSSVTVDGDTKTKWVDYYIDFRAETIIFFSAMSGAEAVIVSYYEGSTNWIYWDKVDIKLSETSFPRIVVQLSGGTGSRLGQYDAPVQSVAQFQIDVWTKEKQANQIFTIGGRAYTGEDLAEYLAYQVMQTIEDNEDELFPVLYDYEPTGLPPRDLPFNEEYQAHHKEVDFVFKGINLGRIS